MYERFVFCVYLQKNLWNEGVKKADDIFLSAFNNVLVEIQPTMVLVYLIEKTVH